MLFALLKMSMLSGIKLIKTQIHKIINELQTEEAHILKKKIEDNLSCNYRFKIKIKQ